MRGVTSVPGVKGRLGDPRGLKGTSGVYQGVKRGVWGVQRGQEGCYGYQGVKGDARGIQGAQVGAQVSQGVTRGVRGVPGVKGSPRDPRGGQGGL